MNFNKVILCGHLTDDPTTNTTKNDTQVTSFSIAVNDKYGETEKVDYFDIVTFNKQAETCAEYLQKGREVLVEGKLRQRRWEQDGQKRMKIEVVASNVNFGK